MYPPRKLTADELYDHKLFYFRKTLRSEDSNSQCAILEHSPNPAWELSRDVVDFGRLPLRASNRRLSEVQRRRVLALVDEVERIPSHQRRQVVL